MRKESVYPICASRCLGPVVFPLPCDTEGRLSLAARPEIERRMEHMDAVLLGPGLGRSEEITALVRWLLGFCHKPLVLDADGINALEGHIDVLRGAACPVIVTPHMAFYTEEAIERRPGACSVTTSAQDRSSSSFRYSTRPRRRSLG